MPAFGVASVAISTEMAAVQPSVKINGSLCDYVFCVAVEDASGIVPSRAMIRYGSNGTDVAAPNTLNKVSWPWTRGSKVEIYAGNSLSDPLLFRGMLVKRHDQGEYDTVMWEAWDYRHLLNFIPVRGCLVYDPNEGVVKFIDRYVTRFNPNGFWNCVGANIGGSVYPVFSFVSDVGKTYQSPDQVFSDQLQEFVITAWTPRRALMYLQLLTTLSEQSIPGLKSPEWRSLSNSANLEWPSDSLNIKAVDVAQDYNPLDRKLADITVQGDTIAVGIGKILKAAQTHGLGIRHDEDKSRLFFYPKQLANTSDGQEKATIPLLRNSGTAADDVNTAFDFEVFDDATETAESVLVEGANVHVEAQFEYDKDNPNTCTIQKEWSIEEQTAFLTGIQGVDVSGTRYATYPAIQGDTDTSNFLTADGNSGRLLALAGSPEAIKLMRRSFPRVFRCYSVASENAWDDGIMKGIDNAFANTQLYPYLKTQRGVLMEQAQFYVDTNRNRLLEKLAVRIQVRDTATPAGWHDVTESTGLRVTPDGRIWLDGLIENIDGTTDCLYQPALTSITSSSTLSDWHARSFRMNARIPLDHRVQGYGFIDGKDRPLDAALSRELEGPLMKFIDSPDSYTEEHQIESRPSPSPEYYSDDGGTEGDTATALTRYLPPGSEAVHAQYAAQRKLATVGAPRRSSSWHMVGIRTEYKVGLWIDCVKMVGGTADADYRIDAPVEQVAFDFIRQRTLIGGLISQLARIKLKDKAQDKPTGTAGRPPKSTGPGNVETYTGNRPSQSSGTLEDEDADLKGYMR